MFNQEMKIGKIFNQYLNFGHNDFINRYRKIHALSVNETETQEFILKKDIWGPKEILTLTKNSQHRGLLYSSRDVYEHNNLRLSIGDNSTFTMVEESVEGIIYACKDQWHLSKYKSMSDISILFIMFSKLGFQQYEAKLFCEILT